MTKFFKFILLPITIIYITTLIFYAKKATPMPEKSFCGVVVGKGSEQIQHSKSSSETVNHFIMNFDSLSSLIDVNPKDITFYTHEKGDRVCFILPRSQYDPNNKQDISQENTFGLLGLIGAIIFLAWGVGGFFYERKY